MNKIIFTFLMILPVFAFAEVSVKRVKLPRETSTHLLFAMSSSSDGICKQLGFKESVGTSKRGCGMFNINDCGNPIQRVAVVNSEGALKNVKDGRLVLEITCLK